MITRLYANNFRCLVAFKADFDSFGVLCGPNGAGKSSVFDALRLIRTVATGDGYLGGDGERDIRHLEFTNWQKGTTQESKIQEFELGVTAEDHSFEYVLHIEQTANHEKPRIVRESATCKKKILFERDLDGVRFKKLTELRPVFLWTGGMRLWHRFSPKEVLARSLSFRMRFPNC